MRYKNEFTLSKFILITALIFGTAFAAHGQVSLYKPLTFFRVIRTDHFDIIFPKESEPSARTLASYADRVYDQVSELLGIEVPGRIPVTFTPHTGSFNGYTNSVPYPHIVLNDTAMDLEWTGFANSLESLFLHELTHAVSLSSRGPFFKGLNRVFGGWASPVLLNSPLFMVEGVTVSFESLPETSQGLEGLGRANDPLIKQKLRQALYEGKFLTPFQASGAYDLPGQEGIWYQYGGLFSAWLQRNYGMEKYAELWRRMGREFPFSFFVYRSGFYRIFKNVYGIDFTPAWNAFSASLALNGLETNGEKLDILPKRGFITAMAAGEGCVYVLSAREKKIRVYDTRNGTSRTINAGDTSSYDIDAAGEVFLLSHYRFANKERSQAAVTEYRTSTGQKTGRSIRGLYKARYFRDGVIGLRAELHNNLIVYENFDGRSEVLFRGNEELVFSGPQAVDNERIAFIAARRGIRELWLYNYVSGELFRVETSGAAENSGDYWRYMRGLGVSEGKLYFSHNADDRMYKLACIDLGLESPEAVFSGRDFSGGVFSPVSVDGSVYYRGAFFDGDSLLRFPRDGPPGERVSLRLTRTEAAGPGLEERPAGEMPQQPAEMPAAAWTGESKPYFPLRYMNPFKMWLPVPLIRMNNDKIRFDGAGLFSIMMDPTDRNYVSILAYADFANRMAMIEDLSWKNTSLGFLLTLNFSDQVIESSGTYRDTRGSITGALTLDLGGGIFLQPYAGGTVVFNAGREAGLESAYQWTYNNTGYFLFAGLGLNTLRRRSHEQFGTGIVTGIRAMNRIDSFGPRVEATFQGSVESPFPLRLSLYGAYDEKGLDMQGVSKTYGSPLFTQTASEEYKNPAGLAFNWLAGAEAAVGLFSFDIQGNFSHLYLNRIFGTLLLRNIVYDSGGFPGAEGTTLGGDLRLAQSAILRLSMVYTIIPVKLSPIRIEPYFWGAWKFSNTISGTGSPFDIGFGFSFNY
jgi:hypothetical protein